MHELQRLLQERVIPEAKRPEMAIVMVPTLLRSHDDHKHCPVAISVRHPKLLPRSRELVTWPEASIWRKRRVRSLLYPHIGIVFNGKIDVLLGVTQGMAKEDPALGSNGLYSLILPKPACLVVPAGVPIGGGKALDTDAIGYQASHAGTFSVGIFPMGVLCSHDSVTDAADDSRILEVFIPDYQCSMTARFLMEALDEDTTQSRLLAHAHLQALLLRIDAMWTRTSTIHTGPNFISNLPTVSANSEFSPLRNGHNVSFREPSVEAACSYIDTHLSEPLSLEHIAANSFDSPIRFNRLFREEMGVSVPEYVRNSRLKAACSMLEHTNLSVKWISRHFAFTDQAHFANRFTQKMGLSPRAYRQLKRNSRIDS